MYKYKTYVHVYKIRAYLSKKIDGNIYAYRKERSKMGMEQNVNLQSFFDTTV